MRARLLHELPEHLLEVAATGPHLVVQLGDVVQLERSSNKLIDHLVKVVVVPAWVVLHCTAVSIPIDGGAVVMCSELATEHCSALAERLAALPDPFWPLVVLLCLVRESIVQVLIICA